MARWQLCALCNVPLIKWFVCVREHTLCIHTSSTVMDAGLTSCVGRSTTYATKGLLSFSLSLTHTHTHTQHHSDNITHDYYSHISTVIQRSFSYIPHRQFTTKWGILARCFFYGHNQSTSSLMFRVLIHIIFHCVKLGVCIDMIHHLSNHGRIWRFSVTITPMGFL